MDTFSPYIKTRSRYQFIIDYPYYGLFGKAQVKLLEEEGDKVYECKLLNGAMLWLKKITSSKWIDLESGAETPLASIVGTYIDDFIKKAEKVVP